MVTKADKALIKSADARAKAKAAGKAAKAAEAASSDRHKKGTDEKSTPWPADQVERRPIKLLIPSARNAWTHPESQVDQLVELIRQFGWTIPILIDEQGEIIAGHGRVLAAQKMGLTDVPTMTARGWTDQQKRAYRLADNQVARNGSWDTKLLSQELIELGDEGFDLPVLGFDEGLIDQLTSFDLPEEDEGPSIHDRPTVQTQSTTYEPNRTAADAYKPTLAPERAHSDVTQADVDRAANKLNSRPGELSKSDLIDLICPHCGETYEIDRKSVV